MPVAGQPEATLSGDAGSSTLLWIMHHRSFVHPSKRIQAVSRRLFPTCANLIHVSLQILLVSSGHWLCYRQSYCCTWWMQFSQLGGRCFHDSQQRKICPRKFTI